MLLLRRIVGESMLPGYQLGDIVIGYGSRKAEVGDVVVARMGDREVVKRVQSINSKGIFLAGDNVAYSTDSRTHGEVPQSAIVGVVMANLHFAKATKPSKVKTFGQLTVPYALAAFIVIVLLMTLMSFETFVFTHSTYLPLGVLGAKLAAITFSATLLFSLPFLLRMRLSPLARTCSAVLVLLLPILLLLDKGFMYAKGLEYCFNYTQTCSTTASGILTHIIPELAIPVLVFIASVKSFYILGGPKVLKT